jgi:hypothetical protein
LGVSGILASVHKTATRGSPVCWDSTLVSLHLVSIDDDLNICSALLILPFLGEFPSFVKHIATCDENLLGKFKLNVFQTMIF